MFKYVNEIDENKLLMQPLTRDNYDLVKGLSCRNEILDDFLINDAIYERGTRTYLFIYDDEGSKKILGFFSLSASGVSLISYKEGKGVKEEEQRYNASGVEIANFALDSEFHHMYWSEISKKEGIKFYLSDFLFTKVLEYITNDIIEVIGITFITLYSVPEAESLYRRRKFEYFGDFMIANNKRYLDGCIPMYIKIDDE